MNFAARLCPALYCEAAGAEDAGTWGTSWTSLAAVVELEVAMIIWFSA